MDEIINIVNRVNRAILSDRAKRVALTTTLARHKPRVFDGTDEDGQKLGKYSTNPISISKSRQARNTGKTYFKGGYAEYKSAIGKNPGYVNLEDTGQMKADYGLIVNGDQYAFGFQNQHNADKMGWMQDKYNKGIAHLSEPELDLFTTVLNDETNKEI